MMASEFYKETLAGYEACLSEGKSVSLSRYCKIHHVNYPGLLYWMKKHSCVTPKSRSRKIATNSCLKDIRQPVSFPRRMIPLLIQPPMGEEAKASPQSKPSLKGVNITTQTGVVVCIPEIGCADLAGLILSCNIR